MSLISISYTKLYYTITEGNVNDYLKEHGNDIAINGTRLICMDDNIEQLQESRWVFLSLDAIIHNDNFVPLYRVYNSSNENDMETYLEFDSAFLEFKQRLVGEAIGE